jgi:hypothetical protein
MTTVRLDSDIEFKLNELSIFTHKSKSEVIKQALEDYFNIHLNPSSPYEIGKYLFGNYGSDSNDNSEKYKSKLKDKINEKYNH